MTFLLNCVGLQKIRCDAAVPICTNCRSNGGICTYKRNIRKRGPKPGYIEELEGRVKELEDLLDLLPPLDQMVAHSTENKQTSKMEVNAPVLSSTSPSEILERFFLQIHPNLPMLHPSLVEESCPLLMNAIYAITTAKSSVVGGGFDESSDYYGKAQQSVDRVCSEPSCHAIVGLILMTRHSFSLGQMTQAWVYIGMANRMAHQLGLNYESPEHDPFIREFRRRIWWCLYEAELYMSIHSDLPFSISAADFQVEPPCSDMEWNGMAKDFGNSASSVLQLCSKPMLPVRYHSFSAAYPLYLHLLQIIANISDHSSKGFHHVCDDAVGATKQELAALDAYLVRLENAIREWMRTVPSWLESIHPTYGFSQGTTKKVPWCIAFIQMAFYFGRIILHVPVIRLALNTSAHSVPAHPSLLLCIESANLMSLLVAKFMADNSDFSNIPSIVSLFVYRGATAHLLLLDVCDGNEETKRERMNTVYMHLKALRNIKGGLAQQYYKSLEALMK